MDGKYRFPLSFIVGFAANVAMVFYVYLVEEGGPISIQQGGNWLEMLNEVPQTILIYIVAVFMPYFMIWSKCRESAKYRLASNLMLVTTSICCLLLIIVEATLSKELVVDIGWVLLWAIALFFLLVPARLDN